MPIAAVLLIVSGGAALAQSSGAGDPKAVSSDDGKYADAQGNPTYSIGADKKVDWYTFSGYVRYTANCMQCHGPDGLGSTYAPALADSLKHFDYTQFSTIVVQGRKNVNTAADKVMPSFGENRNVMCYLDDIYIYLRARSDGALGRGRPEEHAPKPKSYADAENSCMGG